MKSRQVCGDCFPDKYLFRVMGSILIMVWLIFSTSGCSFITGLTPANKALLGKEVDSEKEEKTVYLKIISKGKARPKNKKPRLLIKYIQYTIDGELLEAHEVIKDYERTIDLAPGKHYLHVERLQRGVFSAKALILDDGDCYVFTVSDKTTGVFKGMALPNQKWETKGFTRVRSWKKLDSRSQCTN
jgi:hypothetical protein